MVQQQGSWWYNSREAGGTTEGKLVVQQQGSWWYNSREAKGLRPHHLKGQKPVVETRLGTFEDPNSKRVHSIYTVGF